MIVKVKYITFLIFSFFVIVNFQNIESNISNEISIESQSFVNTFEKEQRKNESAQWSESLTSNNERITVLKFGVFHRGFITSNNKLYMWGDNSYGQLGSGNNLNYNTPQNIDLPQGEKAVQLALGAWHTGVITASNKLYMWGWNQYGQLGAGNAFSSINTAHLIILPNGEIPKLLSTGGNHTGVITVSGKLYMWGENLYSQLGTGDNANYYIPELASLPNGEIPMQLSLGDHHSGVITATNKIYIWGRNYDGQLGLGNNIDYNTSQLLTLPNGEIPVLLSLGEHHTGAITFSNQLYIWGDNSQGQLGLGNDIDYNTPQLVNIPNQEIPVQMSFGWGHSGIITVTNKLYMWGRNIFGELSLDQPYFYTPQLVTLPNSEIPRLVELGLGHTGVITVSNKLYTWGDNSKGQLGNGESGNYTHIPQLIILLEKKSTLKLGGHSGLITSDNKLYMWGNNSFGQLGNGNNINYSTPQLVSLPNGEIPVELTIGRSHTAVITSSNKLYMWGSNSSGELGLGNNIHYNTPQLVSLPNEEIPVQLSLGQLFTGLITVSNKLYMWGYNSTGQLGLGTNMNYNTPQLVSLPNGEIPVQLSLGLCHTGVTTSSNKLYLWGDNTWGQLGNGNNMNYNTPQLITIPNEEIPVQLSLGGHITGMITSSNKLFMWGENAYGQLGLGNNIIECNTPQLVALPDGEILLQLSLGVYHTGIIMASTKIYMWGYNNYGQVGLGNNIIDYKTPQLVSLPNGEISSQISLGSSYSGAISSSNKLYMWGENLDGQLGLGNNINYNSPQLTPPIQ